MDCAFKYLNFGYRLLLDQIYTPFKSVFASGLVMFGNIPSLLYFGNQAVFIHNVNYMRPEWKFKSLRNFLEFYYFYFSNIIFSFRPNHFYYVQTDYVKKEMIKMFGKINISTIGSPLDVKTFLKNFKNINSPLISGRYFIYPAYFYENKNHLLLNKVSKHVYRKFGIKIYSTSTGNLKNIYKIGSLDNSSYYNVLYYAEALIFPSLHESFGYPLVEMSLLNKPVIAIDLPHSNSLLNNFYKFKNSTSSVVQAIENYESDRLNNVMKKPLLLVNVDPSLFIKSILKKFD